MSILTKISVVVLVLLVLFSVPVFITQATVPKSWQAAYDGEVTKNSVLELQGRHANLALNQAVRENEQYRKELSDVRAAMSQETRRLQNQLEVARGNNADLRNELRKVTTTLTDLQGNLKLETEQRVILQGQLDVARKENDRYKTVKRRLEDQLKENRAEVDRLGKVAGVLREQLAEREQRIVDLETQITEGPRAEEKVPAAMPQIDGTVTSVRGDLAGINLGSAKGIRPGMKLIIYRGSQFVGYLRVQEVEVDQAAGTVFEKRMNPIRGDKVTTALLRR